MNCLYEKEGQVVFEKSSGEMIEMPNLSALYKMYCTTEDVEIQKRIKAIFERDFGKVIVAEIMIDMNSPQIIERLRTGEISKTLRHVDDYNIILDSEENQVKMQYEGDFESVCFTRYQYGIVVREEHFPGYKNQNCEMQIKL